ALPLFQGAWPAAPARLESLRAAAALAEQSAAAAHPATGLDDAVVEAVTTAGAALMAIYGMPSDEPVPQGQRAGHVASFGAKAAAWAGKAASGPPEESAAAALEAWDFVRQAAEATGAEGVTAGLRRDLARLCELAARGGWADETPVPPSALGPLPGG